MGWGRKEDMNASWWSTLKDEVSKVMVRDGKVISFGWNSNGMGKKRGFEITRVLLVAHGAMHNDTIVTVERKIK